MGHFLNMIGTFLCHIFCLQFFLILSYSEASPNVSIMDDINGLKSLYTHFLESKKKFPEQTLSHSLYISQT